MLTERKSNEKIIDIGLLERMILVLSDISIMKLARPTYLSERKLSICEKILKVLKSKVSKATVLYL